MGGIDVHPHPSLPAAVALLEAVGLPSSDLTERQLKDFLFCGPADGLVGLIGLEIYGPDALLRSLAVAPAARGAGIGSALVQEAERHALASGVSTVYLLTTTAQRLFEERGYRSVDRETSPVTIRSTLEFTSLCPKSSALLAKTL